LNFTPIYFTGQVCDVSPFLRDYRPKTNVQISGACTAYDNPESGHTLILECHQGLWFGTKLTHSLLNPNQCHIFGLSVCDDPFDPHHDLGIYDPVTDLTVPLRMMGTIAYVTMRAPTWQEIQDCPHIIMTNESEWDPLTLDLCPKSKEVEKYSRIISLVHILDVNINMNPSEPQIQSPQHETDMVLSLVSSALSPEMLVP
jgi:hypothetical protein